MGAGVKGIVSALLFAFALQVQAPRPPQVIVSDLERLVAELKDSLGPLPVQPSQLQAALDKGGEVHLVGGEIYPGGYVLRSGTTLIGHGASFTGSSTGPAIDIPPGTSNVAISDIAVTTVHDSAVILVGRNDSSQTTPEATPTHITLTRVSVPTYRGKRAFEINAADVTLRDCAVADTYDPRGRDSQAVGVFNSPGPFHLTGGTFSAGSEIVLIGGDVMKIPTIPTDILIENATFMRPASWRTDGISRKVKNLLELKTGHHVTARNLILDGAWQDGQDGYAIVMTPHSGGDIADVTVEDVAIRNVSSCLQFLGLEYTGLPSPGPLRGVIIRRMSCVGSKVQSGGRGILAMISGEPADIAITDSLAQTDGTNILTYDPGSVLNPDGTKRVGGPIGSLILTGDYLVAGTYGLLLAGQNNGVNPPNGIANFVFANNSIAGGSSALRSRFPSNNWVDRPTWDALVAAR
jgi:hypothetical protein